MSNQNERLQVLIPFSPEGHEDVQALAIGSIKKHESQFRPFLDRHIQEDARYTFQTGSLDVSDLQIDDTGGEVSITFTSDFYAGCRDQNGTDEHEAHLNFEIRDCFMVFDIELPPRWVIED